MLILKTSISTLITIVGFIIVCKSPNQSTIQGIGFCIFICGIGALFTTIKNAAEEIRELKRMTLPLSIASKFIQDTLNSTAIPDSLKEYTIQRGIILFDEKGIVNETSPTIVIPNHKGPGGDDEYWTCFCTTCFPPYNMCLCDEEKKFLDEELLKMKYIGFLGNLIKENNKVNKKE